MALNMMIYGVLNTMCNIMSSPVPRLIVSNDMVYIALMPNDH